MEGTDLQQRFASLAAGILCLHDPNGHGRRMVAELFKQRPLRLCSDPNFADLLGAALDANSLSDPDQWELAREAVTALVPRGGERPRLLDFGCGVKSDHRLTLESFGYEWNGLELAGTLDAGTQAGFDKLASDSHVTLYDGAGIPFPGASFQVVFSNQSLEHVDDVDHAMHEIARILRPGGLLIGSVSQLEPYHGYSTFNYTPYGLALLGRRHGLALERCTPGIDSLTRSSVQ